MVYRLERVISQKYQWPVNYSKLFIEIKFLLLFIYRYMLDSEKLGNFVYVFSFCNTHNGRPYKRTKIQCKERLFLYRQYHDDMHISVQGNYNN